MSPRPEDGRSDHGRASSTPQHPPSILIRSPSFPSGNRAGHSTGIGSDRNYSENALSETNENVEQEDSVEAPHRPRRDKAAPSSSESSGDGDDESAEGNEDDPITLKDRQSLINVQHPFGLPIWKPALYKKSRSVTRNADEALHSIPSYQAERHFLPGNIFWVFAFGWWLGVVCFFLSAVLYIIPLGGKYYANLVFGLGWYIIWPFGKYVEGDQDQEEDEGGCEDEESGRDIQPSTSTDSPTPRATPSLSTPQYAWAAGSVGEGASLLHLYKHSPIPPPIKSYGAVPSSTSPTGSISAYKMPSSAFLGKVCFWLAFIAIIAPLLFIVCLICWALVVTIPMARLTWALIKHLFERPDTIRFCAAPPVVVLADSSERASGSDTGPSSARSTPKYKIKHAWLAPGEATPSGTSTVLLCTYRAVGLQYYKYTVGGVNILFVNLLPVVLLAIFDGFILEPWVRGFERGGREIPGFLAFIASHGFIFVLCLLSVIPLSYFIGMAVASISAQSSIGMGAVINATFGSIIEIILYGFALTQSKGHLVEGSIIGSLLAGVLLMPGMSMCSGALRRKEQKFNAKSAGVTSMMLIMAIIGALAPTLFYQTYGNVCSYFSICPTVH
jgi:Ca2+:H+ antiporter